MKLELFRNKAAVVLLALTTLTLGSCEDELIELNEDPNAILELPYGIQLTKIQLGTSGTRYEMRRTALGWALPAVQQLADINTETNILPGDKYLDFLDYSAAMFDRVFTEEYRDFADYLARTAEDPEAVNYYNIGRIWHAISYQRFTDLYGDVPYFQAGKGYLENIWAPEYDRQEDIYMDMLQNLADAATALDASAESPGAQDLVYGGDVEKWRKLAYSTMLKLGLRMVKVDPARAETWVRAAIAGGVMTDLTDIAKTEHQATGGWRNTNPIGQSFEVDKFMRISDTFISWMEDNGDPRLDILSWVESGGPHQGLPNGLDATTIPDDMLNYSQINQDLVQLTSPFMFQTYAEVELMLAEAAVRGWHSGDAEEHYNNGVRAAMLNWAFYGVDAPALADIDAYLTANPYDAANGMEMIGEQYWAATFLNPWEGWANYRRTGYPALTPIDYPGNATGGQIPRRMKYPDTEYTVNPDNVREADSRQGANDYMSRMWWDAN